MTNDEITVLLAPLLLRPLTPADRRKIADVLERVAVTQRQLADADTRVGHVVRRVALDSAPPKAQHGQGRTPGDFVRIERVMKESIGDSRTQDVDSRARKQPKIRLHIGRALWSAIGSPARMEVRMVAGALQLVPVGVDAGFAIQARGSIPKFWCDGARGIVKNHPDGSYAAEIRDGAIIVSAPVEAEL